jgi:hypothetical protein
LQNPKRRGYIKSFKIVKENKLHISLALKEKTIVGYSEYRDRGCVTTKGIEKFKNCQRARNSPTTSKGIMSFVKLKVKNRRRDACNIW